MDPGRGPLVAHGLPALGNIRRLRPDLSQDEAAAAAQHQLELEYVDVADVTAAPGAHELLGRAGPAGPALGGGDQRRRPARPDQAGRRPDQPRAAGHHRRRASRQARPGGLPAGRPQARRRSAAVPGGGGRRGRGRGRAGGRRRRRRTQGRRGRYPDHGPAPAESLLLGRVRSRTRGRRRPCEPRGGGRAAAAGRRRRCRCRGGRRRGEGGFGRPGPDRVGAGRR